MTNIIPVILSGGIGSRLWPLSRENHPKPFIRLDDNQSLIQKTYLRALSIDNIKEIITITHHDLFFYTKDEFEEIKKSTVPVSFILEPVRRNTAPAIATVAHYVAKKFGQETVLLILPADHLIDNNNAFLEATHTAINLAFSGKLVTFGIEPNKPETGYGYIEADGNKVLRFMEKPDLETAKHFLSQGNFFWNSGMFCFTASTLLEEMKIYCSEIMFQTKHCLENAKYFTDNLCEKIVLSQSDFSKIKDISIDHAIFEKSKRVAIVPSNIGWSDIGSWIEFGNLSALDEAENHITGDVILDNVNNCIIHSENKMIAGIELKDLIIVDTNDAILVAPRNRAQDVRNVVKKLKNQNHNTYKLSPVVHRPWGTYTVLQEGEGFKIKRIEVKIGAALSLQRHLHRSEHWIVVSGRAKVINDNKEIVLEHNQSTFIPPTHKHRLENIGEDKLIVIEVQCGNYLGEDDIERFDDVYGRAVEY